MLIFSGNMTEKDVYSEDSQDLREEFSRRTGIQVSPTFSPEDESVSMNVPRSLDAAIRIIAFKYSYLYLPDLSIMNALLYPIFISRWKATSTHYTKRSGWENYQLLYTHSGAGILNMDNHVYYLQPHTLCLIDCRTYHYYFATDENGWEYSFIHFSGTTAAFLYQETAEKGNVFVNLKNTDIQRKYDALSRLAAENPSDFDLRFHQLLTSLLVDLACANPEQPKNVIPAWLSIIQSYIIENYNKDWCIKDLARRSCLSESRFSHVFKEYIGSSPIEYRDHLRIEHAKEYLRNTDLSVEEIGEMTGFGTIPGFYSAFSRRTGLTPGKYRKQTFTPDSRSSDSPRTDC